jgi:hypothetical protein
MRPERSVSSGSRRTTPAIRASSTEEFGVTFPTLLDSEDNSFPASNEYGISSVPTMFLVEPGGKIANVIEGWRKREMETLAAPALASLFHQGDYVPEWKAG